MDIFARALPIREYDADQRREMQMVPKAPLCMRCNREATFLNPVGVRFRPTWNPFDKYRSDRGELEALCAECRERLAK